MLPLLAQVSNKETGAQLEAGFKRSPVGIGRNHLNDLAIDEGFVSQWHGLVRFDEETTRFLDLGSTNGTELNGQRLDKNIEIDVDAEMRLAVNPLRSCSPASHFATTGPTQLARKGNRWPTRAT